MSEPTSCRCKECQVEIMALTAKANKGYCRKCHGGLGRNEGTVDIVEDRIQEIKLVSWSMLGAWLGWKLLSHFHWIFGIIGIPLGAVIALVIVFIADLILLFTCGIPMLGGVWLLIILWEWLMKKFRRPDSQDQSKES